MKTLKITAAFLISAVLIFSCTQDDKYIYGNPSYGTVIIKTLGTVLKSDPSAKTHIEELNPKFHFECSNVNTGKTVERGPYSVKDSNNVLFQLPPGIWDIETIVTADEHKDQINPSSHATVSIKAGQTVYLEEKVYTAVNGRAAAPKVTDPIFANSGWKNAANPNWDKSPTLKVNTFQKLDKSTGYVINTDDVSKYYLNDDGPQGTAKVLWDDNFLYVLVLVENAVDSDITDKAHNSNSVEIFFRGNNTIYQYRIDKQENLSYNYTTGTPPKAWYGDSNPKPDFPITTVSLELATNCPSNKSYAVVAKIPISERSNKDRIGFDLQVNGAPPKTPDDGIRYSNAVWCKNIEIYTEKSLPDSLYLVE